MRYVSEDDLVALVQCGDIDIIHGNILEHCKELPPPQWQTIEEFKANQVECFVWLKQKDDKPVMGYFADTLFFLNEDDTYVPDCNITHVMPIKTPEAPK